MKEDMGKNFLLLNLDEPEAKEVHEVLSNKTCKRIIKYLTDKDHAAESEIAKALKIPISTVHYNLQKLKKSRLVVVETFHYSKKGREVDHYKLANKYIIISPTPVKDIASVFKNLLPVGLLLAGVGVVIEFFTRTTATTNMFSEAVPEAMAQTASVAAADVAQRAVELTPAVEQMSQPLLSTPALWFFIGVVTTLLLLAIFYLIRKRRQ